jgi:bacterioferritin
MTDKPFFTDIKEIRERARRHMRNGAVTEGYKADRENVIRLLNEALATELVCVLRYKRHYYMADGIDSEMAAQEFLEHADQEQQHADEIAQRITQLGGEPDLSPDSLLSRSHSEYVEGRNLKQMIEYLEDKDTTTRRMLEDILAVEEEHADDMANLLETYK